MNIGVNIKGDYCFTFMVQTMFINEVIQFKKSNLITYIGEAFFMNRWINDEFTPIQSICLGKGTINPRKSDTKLSMQTIEKKCKMKVDIVNKRVMLSCDFTASEIMDTTEIGVKNSDGKLISHDSYAKIGSTILDNTTSTVHLDYYFSVSTGSIKGNWKVSNASKNIYRIYEPNTVVGVIENNTNSGYVRKNSINELVNGSYYYNKNTKDLYIKNSKNSDPNDDEIIVQTR